MMLEARKLLDKARQIRVHAGYSGVARWALDRSLDKFASLGALHVLSLVPEDVTAPDIDQDVETRVLSADEIRRFARDPTNQLPREFTARAEGGLDFCFGAIEDDRLANYAWYAVRSVEAEHAAGTPMGLPDGIAYMYKAFTHPDFRGRRLHGACMAAALDALGASLGVRRLISFVTWSNDASLRSSERLGYRRLGLLLVGPAGAIRIPRPMRELGVAFGDAAGPALAERRAPRLGRRPPGPPPG